MRIIYIFLIVCLGLISSCRPKYNPTPIFSTLNDFESTKGWMDVPSNNSHTIVDEDAHSGKFCSKIDKSNHYSYFYKYKLGDVQKEKTNWVRVSAYCKLKSDKINKTSIACSIQDDKGAIVNWTEENLAGYLEHSKDKWVYIEKNFNISAYSKPELMLGVFIWNADRDEEVLIDDLKIEFFK
jgi:hypothetical protein